jgi:hypothetical protein
MATNFTAVFNKEETWYVTHCLELGVVSHGKIRVAPVMEM